MIQIDGASIINGLSGAEISTFCPNGNLNSLISRKDKQFSLQYRCNGSQIRSYIEKQIKFAQDHKGEFYVQHTTEECNYSAEGKLKCNQYLTGGEFLLCNGHISSCIDTVINHCKSDESLVFYLKFTGVSEYVYQCD